MMPKLAILAFAVVAAFGMIDAYTTSIHAPAVILNQSIGELTNISLNVSSGTGTVSVIGPGSVGSDTLYSAETAAAYASAYAGANEKSLNFTYDINISGINVSGPSAGLAFTLLAIYGIESKQLPGNFSVTGTIQSDGSVGLVGGVYDKATAVKQKNLKYLIVPNADNASLEYFIYYMAQQELGLPIAQASTVSQALGYVSGSTPIRSLSYSLIKNYSVSELPSVSTTCNGCDPAAFQELTNYTLNFTTAQALSLYPSNVSNAFISVKGDLQDQMLSQLGQYRAIADKGYLYTAADLAFLDYVKGFVFANSYNITGEKAIGIIGNVSAYCNSLIPPPLTAQNYEYVSGGELRQSWANITIQDTVAMVNASSDSDVAIEAVYNVAPAYAWCKAASEMYSIASSMNGTGIYVSQSLKSEAMAAVSNVSSSGTLYSRAAKQLYNNGQYIASLYSATYANVFSGNLPGISFNSSSDSAMQAAVSNATLNGTGVWPYQFALQSGFYLRQAELSDSTTDANSNIQSAYSSMTLSQRLSSVNNDALASMVYLQQQQANGTAADISGELSGLQQQFNKIYELSLVIILLLVMVIVAQSFFINMLLRRTKNGRKR
ncbi:MAG: hypothetical protein KGH69_04245 [Candidatus Micrarchaeota archaeon]|nr:hypothetical protein [Candidatus Micrarchaeota archaeon]